MYCYVCKHIKPGTTEVLFSKDLLLLCYFGLWREIALFKFV